jgi:hypothetical protein
LKIGFTNGDAQRQGSWTAVSNTAFGSSGIYGIAYGNGKFVAVV